MLKRAVDRLTDVPLVRGHLDHVSAVSLAVRFEATVLVAALNE
ncbi:hypothetical protein [Streptomyces sp. NRRL S-337]|nr:hypothetical protein [Streptomyces sp. NRRL S-337]